MIKEKTFRKNRHSIFMLNTMKRKYQVTFIRLHYQKA